VSPPSVFQKIRRSTYRRNGAVVVVAGYRIAWIVVLALTAIGVLYFVEFTVGVTRWWCNKWLHPEWYLPSVQVPPK